MSTLKENIAQQETGMLQSNGHGPAFAQEIPYISSGTQPKDFPSS